MRDHVHGHASEPSLRELPQSRRGRHKSNRRVHSVEGSVDDNGRHKTITDTSGTAATDGVQARALQTQASIQAKEKEVRLCFDEGCPHYGTPHEHPVAIAMLLWCPACHQRHIDEGEFAMKVHHTHACQHCGMVWRPAIEPTCGVQFLPGFKNEVRTP